MRRETVDDDRTLAAAQRRAGLIAAIIAILAIIMIAAGVAAVMYRLSQTSTNSRPSTTEPFMTVGVPGIGPFVGSWRAHGESLVIEASGHGHQTLSGGSVDFTFTSVSGNTAKGSVTTSSKRDSTVPGDPVTVTLVGNGQGLELSRGKETQFPYCNTNATSQTYCGA